MAWRTLHLLTHALLQLQAMECFLLYLEQEDKLARASAQSQLAIFYHRRQVGRGMTLAGKEAVARDAPKVQVPLPLVALSQVTDEVSEKCAAGVGLQFVN